MAKGDTFFLRARIDVPAATGTTYNTDNIDISAYTDPARGRVLVVDRGFVTFTGDGPAAILEADIAAADASRACMTQACSEIQTDLVNVGSNNAVFMENTLYAATDNTKMTLMDQQMSLNPIEFTGGFIIPTDGIHVGAKCPENWAGQLKVNFLFEVHTETLSLRRIQELLVSLTAN
jgi:hypothetical protein